MSGLGFVVESFAIKHNKGWIYPHSDDAERGKGGEMAQPYFF